MWEYGNILQSYEPERLAMMHAYHTAIDMGIYVAGHSDSPISAADPLLRIQDMVTRKSQQGVLIGGNQRVSMDEALRVWTLDGAYATFEENIKGSITPGKLADFVVLQKDLESRLCASFHEICPTRARRPASLRSAMKPRIARDFRRLKDTRHFPIREWRRFPRESCKVRILSCVLPGQKACYFAGKLENV